MSVSLTSKEVTVVDVPEVGNFFAEFIYDFHVADELVNEDASNVPASILRKPAETFDADIIDRLKTRIPRFIKLSFTPVHIQDPTMSSDNSQSRAGTANRKIGDEGLLRRFYDKIVGEQEFASDTFKIVNFSDQGIVAKLHDFVSGSLVNILEDAANTKTADSIKVQDFQNSLRSERAKDPSTTNILSEQIKQFNSLTPNTIGYDFISRALINLNETGIYTIKANGEKEKGSSLEGLKNVSLRSQINSKVFDTIVKSAYHNPTHTISSELTRLAATSDVHQKEARSKDMHVSQADYMTVVDPYEVVVASSANVSNTEARIIGYVIDKWRLLPDGTLLAMEPILLENQHVNTTIDYKVKYGATYAYQVRTVAEFKMSAVTLVDSQLVSIKMLISSRPTRKVFVECTEKVPPPWPTDVDFVWDYENDNLIVTWTFPPNPQRDIKKFQIFRRQSVREPFQLLKVYDFDDTVRGEPYVSLDLEHVPKEFIEYLASPKLTYIDSEFTKNSKAIYAICAIDAHGFTSNYSTQMEVYFDRFENRLAKKMICASNCPKPYPNMNLVKDPFVETMFHENGSRMKIYFTPEFLEVYDNEQRAIPIISTNKTGASYRINIINLDVQKQQSVDITIEDVRKFDKAKDAQNPKGLKSVDANRFST